MGSIPAYAGNPRLPSGHSGEGKVYPRLRGEPWICKARHLPMRGLSPPTRGTRARRTGTIWYFGSIPAYAGNPDGIICTIRTSGVYPRLRGEPACRSQPLRPGRGLSPPTRGTPMPDDGNASVAGSIPAYAGNPIRYPLQTTGCGVYPRLRGEPPPL